MNSMNPNTYDIKYYFMQWGFILIVSSPYKSLNSSNRTTRSIYFVSQYGLFECSPGQGAFVSPISPLLMSEIKSESGLGL